MLTSPILPGLFTKKGHLSFRSAADSRACKPVQIFIDRESVIAELRQMPHYQTGQLLEGRFPGFDFNNLVEQMRNALSESFDYNAMTMPQVFIKGYHIEELRGKNGLLSIALDPFSPSEGGMTFVAHVNLRTGQITAINGGHMSEALENAANALNDLFTLKPGQKVSLGRPFDQEDNK